MEEISVRKLTPEKVAEKVAGEIDKICQKYNCEIGVWLSWRDLLANFEHMKKDPNINELQFGLQIRFDADDKDKTGNT